MEFSWSDVTGICGFWDGTCHTVGCGAGMWVHVFTGALGCHTVHVNGEWEFHSLDAESVKKWVGTCVS